MNPEHMILELADGSVVSGTMCLKSGYLCIQIGGFLGLGEILIRPRSAKQIATRTLEILDSKAHTTHAKDSQGNNS
jgi:hypothetical protein